LQDNASEKVNSAPVNMSGQPHFPSMGCGNPWRHDPHSPIFSTYVINATKLFTRSRKPITTYNRRYKGWYQG